MRSPPTRVCARTRCAGSGGANNGEVMADDVLNAVRQVYPTLPHEIVEGMRPEILLEDKTGDGAVNFEQLLREDDEGDQEPPRQRSWRKSQT